MKGTPEQALKVFTIGHSSRSFEQFLSLLQEFGVKVIADIRRYPGSEKFPHFNSRMLSGLLAAADFGYIWFEALGGLRHQVRKDSQNVGLTSLSFRSYADYMATQEFRTAVERLLAEAAKQPTAVMCAEKLFWKCHRRLLSDYLAAHGVEVWHIIDSGRLQRHELTAGAVVTPEGPLTYPALGPDDPTERGLFDI